MNPGIRAAFLCDHHCPLLHTCGIYPQHPQNTWLATTSNDKLGQREDKIAPPFVEEVHWGVPFHFCLAPKGAPLLIGRPGQVRATRQFGGQAFDDMSLSAIGNPENAPRY